MNANSFTLPVVLVVVLITSVSNDHSGMLQTSVGIDTEKSIIRWKGTKMMYTRSHEGTIRFKSGDIILKGNDITGGQLIVDMTSIEITDIPAHEPVPRNNLKSHLESDFETSRFSTASLSIRKAVTADGLCGDLTIKGVTREVCFRPVEMKRKSWRTKLIIRREDFTIGEQGSWLEKRLVDQEIELEVELHLK